MTYEWYSSGNRSVTWTDKTVLNEWLSHDWINEPTRIWTYPPTVYRYPKNEKKKWQKYVKPKDKVIFPEDVIRNIEVRPVMICGWCGARISRGKEDEPCEYCGS
jgi:hypothetical protein